MTRIERICIKKTRTRQPGLFCCRVLIAAASVTIKGADAAVAAAAANEQNQNDNPAAVIASETADPITPVAAAAA